MILSSRFWNSGRKCLADRAHDLVAWKRPSAGAEKPSPEVRWLVAPRLVVRMMMQWRKSATWPSASVSRPSSNTCRNRSQTRGCAFSNSSSSTTEKGCLRTRLIERVGLAIPPPPRILAMDSAVWNSLMSRRIMRSTEPNRYSAMRLRKLGLAGAGRAGEQEHADRLARIVEAGLEHGDAIDDGTRPPRPGR